MKKKLTLKDLKVQSFVTSVTDKEVNALKGGAGPEITGLLGGNCVSLLGLSLCDTCGIVCTGA